MGVVIESDVWEPNQALYVFLFVACFISILCLPRFSNTSSRNSSVFDNTISPPFPRFQRNFLLLYSLASALEGLWSVFGEYELAYRGISREQMLPSLCIGYAAALFLGTFSGVLSDLIGQKKVCLLFCVLHLSVGIWKRLVSGPSVWLASICLALASSIYSFSFETWMVIEHEKLGFRQDTVNDMFWLMSFFEAASLIGSQVLMNWLVGGNMEKSIVSPSTPAFIVVIITIIYISRGWKEASQAASFKDYKTFFCKYIFGAKRVWLLAWTQTCVQFSIAVFWILWAPTVVADGREVLLGLIYPCLLGARMLGSSVFPWFVGGPLSLRTEDCLVYVLTISGLLLSIVAFDYQEIGVLVTLFCLFHVCIGLILPALARLRTMYVPNELRGGMMSLSLAPSNAAVLFFLVQAVVCQLLSKDLNWVHLSMNQKGSLASVFTENGKPKLNFFETRLSSGFKACEDKLLPRWLSQGGYYRNIANSTIIGLAAVGLFSAAGCMHLLRQWGKQPHQGWHKL